LVSASHPRRPAACPGPLAQQDGVSLMTEENDGRQPIHIACDNGHLELVKWLAEQDGGSLAAEDNDGWQPIHRTCRNGHLELVKWLAKQDGASLTAEEKIGRQPIHIACQYGHLKVVKWLADEGEVSLTAEDNDGWQPIHCACGNGHLELVKWLVVEGGVSLTAETNDGSQLIHRVCFNGHLKVAQWLADEGGVSLTAEDNDGWQAIHCACDNGNLDLVKWLAEQDEVSLTVEDIDGRQPIHIACDCGHLEVVKWLAAQDGVSLTAEAHKDFMSLAVSDTANDGWQPIHGACGNGNLDLVKWLADEGGVSLTAEDIDGRQPIQIACDCGHLEVVKWLAEQDGVSLMATTKAGWLPIHIACRNGHLEVVKWMVEQDGVSLMTTTKAGWLPIHIACRNGHLEVVKWLEEQDGVLLTVKIKNGSQPIHIACEEGHIKLAQWLANEGGVSLTVEDIDGRQPIHITCENGHLEVVKWLADQDGVSLTADDKNGKQPIHIARLKGHLEVVKWLAERQAREQRERQSRDQRERQEQRERQARERRLEADLDLKLTSESLLAKARSELYTKNFEGARKNWSKAAKIFQQVGPGDKPFSKQVGTWVRICELDADNEAEYNGATGTILDIDLKDKEELALAFAMGTHERLGSGAGAGGGVQGQGCLYMDMPAKMVKKVVEHCGDKGKVFRVRPDQMINGCPHILLGPDQVEDPLAELRRLDTDIDNKEKLDKEERERKRELKEKLDKEKRERERVAMLKSEKNILENLLSGKHESAADFFTDAIDKGVFDHNMIQKLAKRFEEQKTKGGLGVHLSVQKVRTLIKDDMLFFKALIPCLCDASLKEALKFCAKKSRIDFSDYKEYWPLLKPLLQSLPTANMNELPVLAAIEHRDQEALALLIQAGADPNFERDDFGLSSLHAALDQGEEDFVRTLLGAKADCNLKLHREAGKGADLWKGHSTPLHHACMISDASKSQRMVSLLLEHGNVDFSIQNRQKKTALDIAQHKSVKEMLTRSQQESKLSKKKQQQNAATGKPDTSSPASQQITEPGQTSNSSADGKQTKSNAETASAKAALTIEERLRALLSSLEQKVPCITGITAESIERIGKNFEAENSPSSGALVVNGPCSQNAGAASQVRLLEEKEVQVSSCSNPADESDDAVEIAEDERAAAAKRTLDASFDLSFSSQAKWTWDWDLRFTREFKKQLFTLFKRQPVLLKSLVEQLNRLARGERGKNLYKQLKGVPKSLRIYESPVKTFNDGPRFLWQFSVDYSPRIRAFTECIRLWRLCLQHDDVPKGIEWIISSHKRGRASTMKKGLIASFKGSTLCPDGRRVPRLYKVCEGVDMEDLKNKDAIRFESLTEDEEEGVQNLDNEEEGQILFTPPAVSNADSFNVLKFYQLSDEVLQSLRTFQSNWNSPQGQHKYASSSGAPLPEFPFIPDEREDSIINSNMNWRGSHSSILLVGRSGTGKTSIAVGRMWALYKHCHSDSWHGGPYNQVFVTANRVLRDQVRKSFQGMKHGFKGVQEEVSEYPHTLRDVPEGMFPLFLTQGEFLKMLDGTLAKPFWPRTEDGSLKHPVDNAFHEEAGMLDEIPDEDFEYFSDNPDDAHGQSDAEPLASLASVEIDKRVEIDFKVFQTDIWPKLCKSKTQVTNVSPASLFQEIHSYIKGSSNALRSVDGRLTRQEYNDLGAKMAPNFKKTLAEDLPGDRSASRDFVFDLFLKYEEEKKMLGGYDISDVVFHIWSQLAQQPAEERTLIHSIFVDETQDFTQAELALFVRIAKEKNDLFFSGDTCQTIAYGVGFRFEDLKSIFKYEADRQLDELSAKAQSLPAGLKVKIPEVNTLTVNYRTHNGILAAAAGIVDLLEFFFPQA
jgi:ankyrin repeat protein